MAFFRQILFILFKSKAGRARGSHCAWGLSWVLFLLSSPLSLLSFHLFSFPSSFQPVTGHLSIKIEKRERRAVSQERDEIQTTITTTENDKITFFGTFAHFVLICCLSGKFVGLIGDGHVPGVLAMNPWRQTYGAEHQLDVEMSCNHHNLANVSPNGYKIYVLGLTKLKQHTHIQYSTDGISWFIFLPQNIDHLHFFWCIPFLFTLIIEIILRQAMGSG